jgi:Ca2+-dependent lipid-binding protein
LTVFDQDVTSDDKVGEVSIKISSLCTNGGIDEWFEIQYKGKVAGKVHLISRYTPEGQTEHVQKK